MPSQHHRLAGGPLLLYYCVLPLYWCCCLSIQSQSIHFIIKNYFTSQPTVGREANISGNGWSRENASGQGCKPRRSTPKPSSLPSVTVYDWKIAVGQGVKVPSLDMFGAKESPIFRRHSRGPPVRRWCCQSNTTALLVEAAFFIPRYERNPPVAPSDYDRLVSGYRLISGYSLTQTALYRDTTI